MRDSSALGFVDVLGVPVGDLASVFDRLLRVERDPAPMFEFLGKHVDDVDAQAVHLFLQ